MCIADHERNAGFAMKKLRKMTGEWKGEMRTGVAFPTFPSAALFI